MQVDLEEEARALRQYYESVERLRLLGMAEGPCPWPSLPQRGPQRMATTLRILAVGCWTLAAMLANALVGVMMRGPEPGRPAPPLIFALSAAVVALVIGVILWRTGEPRRDL